MIDSFTQFCCGTLICIANSASFWSNMTLFGIILDHDMILMHCLPHNCWCVVSLCEILLGPDIQNQFFFCVLDFFPQYNLGNNNIFVNCSRCSSVMELSSLEMLFSWQRRKPRASSLLMKLMPLEQSVLTGTWCSILSAVCCHSFSLRSTLIFN